MNLVERFFFGTGTTYDAMVHYATFGIDRRWKRRMLDLMPPHPTRILDLASGTGISTLMIAGRFPSCQVVGVELRQEYLEIARAKVERLGIRNVEFVLSRAEDYRSTEPFDCVTSSYLAKYADLQRLIPVTAGMLREGGLCLMHDFTYPPNAFLVRIWRLYFWVLQRIGARFFPTWHEIFDGLPRLIARTRWIPELTEAFRDNGFVETRVEHLTAYGSAIVTARKGARLHAPAAGRGPDISLQS
ncbi:MAG: class I SAM-dependent methyltransferase [Nitrospirota bacterium]|nr:class I SAM-dependent methyltransferase [Nitrospirota bacterium]